MEYNIRIKYAEVEVAEDSYEQGELGYVNSWDIPHLKGREFDTIESLIQAIADETYIFSDDKQDYIYIDGRIDTDATVNDLNERPSDAEYEDWKRGEIKLYNAHLLCGLEMVPKGYTHDMTDEEAEEFGLEVY